MSSEVSKQEDKISKSCNPFWEDEPHKQVIFYLIIDIRITKFLINFLHVAPWPESPINPDIREIHTYSYKIFHWPPSSIIRNSRCRAGDMQLPLLGRLTELFKVWGATDLPGKPKSMQAFNKALQWVNKQKPKTAVYHWNRSRAQRLPTRQVCRVC